MTAQQLGLHTRPAWKLNDLGGGSRSVEGVSRDGREIREGTGHELDHNTLYTCVKLSKREKNLNSVLQKCEIFTCYYKVKNLVNVAHTAKSCLT